MNDRELLTYLKAEQRWLLEECDRLDGWMIRVEAAGRYRDDAERDRFQAALAELDRRQGAVAAALRRRTAN